MLGTSTLRIPAKAGIQITTKAGIQQAKAGIQITAKAGIQITTKAGIQQAKAGIQRNGELAFVDSDEARGPHDPVSARR